MRKGSDKPFTGLKIDVINGNVEKAIKTLTKKVQTSGILKKYRELQEYKKPSEVKREAKKEAIKRQKKLLKSKKR